MLGSRVRAPGATREAARVCTPGSLDAGAVADRIVLCERGTVGRVDKSRAVSLADGVGMVLVNDTRGSLDEDFHSVPDRAPRPGAGRDLMRWLAAHPRTKISLRPVGLVSSVPRVASWSSAGDPSAALLKPDLVAPATGILGSTPEDARGVAWDFVTGTSAATAYAAGVAATLLAGRDLSATEVRSALATTAQPLTSGVLAAGAGRVRAGDSTTPGLVYPARRRRLPRLAGGPPDPPQHRVRPAQRRPAVGPADDHQRRLAALYFSSRTLGFERRVTVTPAAVRLDPGESATYRITMSGRGRTARLDDGYVVWRGASGTLTRIPVLISR